MAAIKARCPELFVNARVDTYWLGQDADHRRHGRTRRALHRGGRGRDFVPGASEPDVLRGLTANLPVPVNVLVIPALSLDELAALGVRRVSTGSLPYRAAMHTAVEVAGAVRDGRPVPAATPYPELQARLVQFNSADRRR